MFSKLASGLFYAPASGTAAASVTVASAPRLAAGVNDLLSVSEASAGTDIISWTKVREAVQAYGGTAFRASMDNIMKVSSRVPR